MADKMPRLCSPEEFRAWQTMQPGLWELHDGVPVQAAPEDPAHSRTVALVRDALCKSVRAANPSCEVTENGPVIDLGLRQFVPDLVVVGKDMLNSSITLTDAPLVVVEVLSSATAEQDNGIKLEGYFEHGFVQHCLVVWSSRPMVIHYSQADAGTFWTRLHRTGFIRLDPPGLTVPVEAVYDNSLAGSDPA